MMPNTIQECYEQALRNHKDKIAIEHGKRLVSYNELELLSNRIKKGIQERGIKTQTVIAVMVEDKVDFIAAILGILKAGCIFAPLDMAHPLGRLVQMVKASEIQHLLTDTRNLGIATELAKNLDCSGVILRIMDWTDVGSEEENKGGAVIYHAADPIYLFFTSGSTGIPKAVLGKNESLLHFVNSEIKLLGVGEGTRFSQVTATGFDAILRDIFVPLCSGGIICVPERRETILESSSFRKWITESNVEVIHCTPTLFKLINSDEIIAVSFPELKYILMAGESINPREIRKWYHRIGDRVQLVNLYGATETTMVKAVYFINPKDCERETIPVGKGMEGATLRILDSNMNECGVGEVGEIYIETPYMTYGYYNNESMNQDKFLLYHVNGETVVVYKTGDLGVVGYDGNIECLGRMDRQVKIRGIRIELRDIENQLVETGIVSEAVVDYRSMSEKDDDNKQLVAYYVSDEAIRTQDIIDRLKHLLPEYTIPLYYIRIDQIPVSPNGKINLEALPNPILKSSKKYIAPKNEIEMELLEICGEVLGKNSISLHDDLFELGAHSLNIMSIVARIYQRFEVEVPLEVVFTYPVLQRISDYITNNRKSGSIEIRRIEQQEYYPLSPAQRRIFIKEQTDDKKTSYNISTSLILNEDIEMHKLKHAIERLVTRHEIMLATFGTIDGSPVQYLNSSNASIELLEIDYKSADKETKLKKLKSRFDLKKGPLFRFGVIKVSEVKKILVFVIHHLIADGRSIRLILRDLFSLLKTDESLPELPIRYIDYADWINHLVASEKKVELENYWLTRMNGFNGQKGLPTDFEKKGIRSYEGGKIVCDFNYELKEKLNQVAVENNVTLFMLLFSAFSVLYAMYSAEDDIVIATSIEGRRHHYFENMVGMFVNVLAIRTQPTANKRFNTYLKEVKEYILKSYDHDYYQFDELISTLQIPEHILYDTVFYVQYFDEEFEESTGYLEGDILYGTDTEYEDNNLRVMLYLTPTRMVCHVKYSKDLFGEQTVQKMIEDYSTVLNLVCTDGLLRIGDISLRSVKELPEKKQVGFASSAFNF